MVSYLDGGISSCCVLNTGMQGANDIYITGVCAMSCGGALYYFAGVCSGRGECILVQDEEKTNANWCECASGWGNKLHWLNDTAGKDCLVNNTLVRSFWAFGLVWISVISLYYFPTYLRCLRQFRMKGKVAYARQRMKWGSGETLSNGVVGKKRLRDNPGLWVVTVHFFGVAPSYIVLCLLGILTDQRVGLDIPFTLAWHYSRSLFYMNVTYYQTKMVEALVGKQNIDKLPLHMQPRVHYVFFSLMNVLTGLLSWVAYFSRDPYVQRKAMVCFFAGTGVALCVFGLLGVYIKRKLKQVLSESASSDLARNDKIKETKHRLDVLQNHVVGRALLQSVIYLVLAHTSIAAIYVYYLPLSGAFSNHTIRLLMKTLVLETSRARNPSYYREEGIDTIIGQAVDAPTSTELTNGPVYEVVEVRHLFSEDSDSDLSDDGGKNKMNEQQHQVKVRVVANH